MSLKVISRPGSRTLYITGTIRNQLIRESTGTDQPRLAEEYRQKRERELYERFLHGDKATFTFSEAVVEYLEDEQRSPSTCRFVGKLLDHFGETKLSAIDQVALVAAYKAILTPDATGSTKIRAVLTPLRAIMEHAAILKRCDRPAFKAPKVPAFTKTAFLKPDEANALIEAAAPHLRPLLVFLVGTGVRMSEALDLQWSTVDLYGKRAVVWQKQQNERQVDLPPVVMAAISALPHREGFLFRPPVRKARGKVITSARYADLGRDGGGQIATGFMAACRRAGLPGRMMTNAKRPYFQSDLRPHDLRHTWASWQYAIHKDPLRLMVHGGWSNVKQVQRYVHLMPDVYIKHVQAWLGADLIQIEAAPELLRLTAS